MIQMTLNGDVLIFIKDVVKLPLHNTMNLNNKQKRITFNEYNVAAIPNIASLLPGREVT